MKTIKNLFLSLSITIILFTLTMFRYDIICMEENQQGYGHFLVWLKRGFTSLSYQIDLFKLIFDFSAFFIIIFFIIHFYKKKFSKWFNVIIYCISLIILLMMLPYFLVTEIYFDKIDCSTIYSSICLGWFN